MASQGKTIICSKIICEALLDGLEKTQKKGTGYPAQRDGIDLPPMVKPMKNLGDKLSD